MNLQSSAAMRANAAKLPQPAQRDERKALIEAKRAVKAKPRRKRQKRLLGGNATRTSGSARNSSWNRTMTADGAQQMKR